jgi:hypothetical protein
VEEEEAQWGEDGEKENWNKPFVEPSPDERSCGAQSLPIHIPWVSSLALLLPIFLSLVAPSPR